jgi:hypothetical protein
MRREHNERAWAAWHVAALSRAKKIPKLETLLIKDGPAKAARSTQDMGAVLDMWRAVTEGMKKKP